MKLTTNYGLKKPEGSDVVNIDDFNYNADIIDNTFKEIKTDTISISDEYIAQLFENNNGDETNPLAYYTKSEIDTKIKTIDNNINTNKNLINQAIEKSEQAFQYGDNVKSKLVDKLISEGLNVSTNNTFEELIGKIALGKKWASGEGVASSSTTNFTYSDSSSVLSKSYVDITLSFKPSIIVVSSKYNGGEIEYLSILNNMGYLSSIDNVKCSMYTPSVTYSATAINFKNDKYISLGNNVYRVPLIGAYSTISKLKWIAYE